MDVCWETVYVQRSDTHRHNQHSSSTVGARIHHKFTTEREIKREREHKPRGHQHCILLLLRCFNFAVSGDRRFLHRIRFFLIWACSPLRDRSRFRFAEYLRFLFIWQCVRCFGGYFAIISASAFRGQSPAISGQLCRPWSSLWRLVVPSLPIGAMTPIPSFLSLPLSFPFGHCNVLQLVFHRFVVWLCP